MSHQYQRIKEIIPAIGDWFVIATEPLGGGEKRCLMSRVTVWGIFYGEKIDDHLQGIDAHGYGHVFEHIDYVYVNGSDVAPDGRKWQNVFNETPPLNEMAFETKDITKVIPK